MRLQPAPTQMDDAQGRQGDVNCKVGRRAYASKQAASRPDLLKFPRSLAFLGCSHRPARKALAAEFVREQITWVLGTAVTNEIRGCSAVAYLWTCDLAKLGHLSSAGYVVSVRKIKISPLYPV